MLNISTTRVAPLTITTTAHSGVDGKFVMFSVECDGDVVLEPKPLDVALVIDRSGSMSGDKLRLAREAVADFIQSLSPRDHVAVVAYDDEVEVVVRRCHPSPELGALVRKIEDRGSTNLYGGWLAGAKMLKPGGSVILLSDGLANVGRFTDGGHLSAHAKKTFEAFRVSTSTIGVGTDYDEALMAGMARSGGGSHYFAQGDKSIREAFAQERYNLGAAVVGEVRFGWSGGTENLGPLFAGEQKRLENLITELSADSVSFMPSGGASPTRSDVHMPVAFGHSDEVTLGSLVAQASAVEAESTGVTDARSAASVRANVRAVMLKLLAHPLSDREDTRTIVARLQASLARLDQLRTNYDEGDAQMHRKRSMQSSHNMVERARSYSSFAEDQHLVVAEQRVSQSSAPSIKDVDSTALSLAPLEQWRAWRVAPLAATQQLLTIGMELPRDGFLVAEIEKATGKRVAATRMTALEIERALSAVAIER